MAHSIVLCLLSIEFVSIYKVQGRTKILHFLGWSKIQHNHTHTHTHKHTSHFTLHTPDALVLGKIADRRWTEGWLGPRASLNMVTYRYIIDHGGNWTPMLKPIAQLWRVRYIVSFQLRCKRVIYRIRKAPRRSVVNEGWNCLTSRRLAY